MANLRLMALRSHGLWVDRVKGELELLSDPVLMEFLRTQMTRRPKIVMANLSEVEFLGRPGWRC
jgi:hypothetical protein